MADTIRCWSFFVTADNEIHTTFPRSTISVFKAIILPLRAELWRVFSLRQQTFSPGGLPTEETTQTSAITITRAYEVRSHVKNAQLQC